jgi:LemA protein
MVGFSGMIAFWIVLAVIALVVVWFIAIYNRLVGMRQGVRNAWAQIDVQLKRRADLIPNIVETVKGYAAHERGVFEEVTKARSAWAGAKTVQEHAQADNMITAALKSLFAVAEAYPDLKANQNFLALQQELSNTEGQIASARSLYNTTVQDYNTQIQVFPASMVASMTGFRGEPYFQAEEPSREPVQVKF